MGANACHPGSPRQTPGGIGQGIEPRLSRQGRLGKGALALPADLCRLSAPCTGKAAKLGPDLTGSGRSNLDYILENVVDPSAVVSADYRMTILELKDGRFSAGWSHGAERTRLPCACPVRRRCWRSRRSHPGKSFRIRSCPPVCWTG